MKKKEINNDSGGHPQDKGQDESYNAFKEFQGQKYTGMKVGRGHSWHYDQGAWKEKKITPDLWEFNYNVNKRCSGKAPEGSGVPVGTEYHWYILAHQSVRKLDANTYSTVMRGYKYKLAHKRADKETWSTGYQGQRRWLIKIFQTFLHHLEKEEAAEGKKTVPRRRKASDPSKSKIAGAKPAKTKS